MRLKDLYGGMFTRRRLVIWGGGAAIVCLLAIYGIWSKQTWTQYQQRYTEWHQQMKTDTDKMVAMPTATTDDRSKVLNALAATTRQIDATRGRICTVHPLLQWQTTIESFKEEQVACQSVADQMAKFSAQLQEVGAYLQNDQALAHLITVVPQADEMTEEAWSVSLTAWQNTAKQVQAMKVEDDFMPVKTQAATKVIAVTTAWQEVVAAHQAKDKKRYLGAQNALAAAYDGLNEISLTSDRITTDLANNLQEEYKKTFH